MRNLNTFITLTYTDWRFNPADDTPYDSEHSSLHQYCEKKNAKLGPSSSSAGLTTAAVTV